MDIEALNELIGGLSDEEKAQLAEAVKPEPKAEVVDVKAEVITAVTAALAEQEKQRKDTEAEEAKKALAEEQAKAHETRKVDPQEEAEKVDGAPAVHYSGISSYQVKEASDLLHIKKADLEAGRFPKKVGKEFITDFQAWNDDMYLLSRILHQNGHYPDVTRFQPYRDFWGNESVQKALYSTSAGYGDEWVPTEFSTDWMEKVGTQGEVLPTFRSFDMTTNPETFPVFAGRSATAYLQGEATQDTESQATFRSTTVTTAQLSMTAKQIAIRICWSQEFAEDAIAGSMDYVRQDLANSAANNLDEAIIHGDASANGFDTGYTYESDSRYKAFNGLRYYVKVTDTTARTSAASVTWSSAPHLLNTLAAMGKYAGDNPVLLVDKTTGAKLGLLRDGSNNLVASPTGVVDSAAKASAKLTGILGMRVINSEAMWANLTSAGIYDGTTTTYVAPLIYNPDAFYIGRKRGWTLETEKNILTGTWDLVMTVRLAFGTPYLTGEVVGEAYGLLAAW